MINSLVKTLCKITISQGRKGLLQIASFVQPTVQNPKTKGVNLSLIRWSDTYLDTWAMIQSQDDTLICNNLVRFDSDSVRYNAILCFMQTFIFHYESE